MWHWLCRLCQCKCVVSMIALSRTVPLMLQLAGGRRASCSQSESTSNRDSTLAEPVPHLCPWQLASCNQSDSTSNRDQYVWHWLCQCKCVVSMVALSRTVPLMRQLARRQLASCNQSDSTLAEPVPRLITGWPRFDLSIRERAGAGSYYRRPRDCKGRGVPEWQRVRDVPMLERCWTA